MRVMGRSMNFQQEDDTGMVTGEELLRDTRVRAPLCPALQLSDPLEISLERDQLLTEFGRLVMGDRYLLPDEPSPQNLFARVAKFYGDNLEHSRRLYDYMSRLWFMPATPVLSNGGTSRGLPISCFLNEAPDSLEGILGLWNENVWLASRGGGIGSYWGNLRSVGERVGLVGKTSGIVPFIKVMDSMTLAISQGSLRRGSAAVYLPISHPEIEEFIEMRRPTGGDPNRRTLNLHHGIVVSDAFMRAVEQGTDWELRSPVGHHVVAIRPARDLWIRILTARIETGEPYIIFIDQANRLMPEHQKLQGLEIKSSNLCSEILLPTGKDRHNGFRTAVCCLSSLNLEAWDEWKGNDLFIEDVMRFLDNVLEDFIQRAPEQFEQAVYSAKRSRSVGLGVMGFHSYLQKCSLSMGSPEARSWNIEAFRHIRLHADRASRRLAHERGACPDAHDFGFDERFSDKLAVAPTASISIICGEASPGIEPYMANAYAHKTLSGTVAVRNRALRAVLQELGRDTEEVWQSIASNEGSAQNLDFLSDHQKQVFQTAFEMDQNVLVDLAAERSGYICQGQSLNLFLPSDVEKHLLHSVHLRAWKKGVKSVYYCRSRSMQRSEANHGREDRDAGSVNAGRERELRRQALREAMKLAGPAVTNPLDGEGCLACE